jgi:uncharacterized HhH-GPD family protein
VALLGKQLGVRPAGWEAAAGAYAEEGSRRSVADVVDAASLREVRTYKQQQKAALRSAAARGSDAAATAPDPDVRDGTA